MGVCVCTRWEREKKLLTGMSICSPGRRRCSSKQKHCILLKYTAACKELQTNVECYEARAIT